MRIHYNNGEKEKIIYNVLSITSRNMAKLSVAKEFGNEYTEMRCKTLKKGVNVPLPMLVTHPDDKGYEIVKSCGYEYGTDDI